MMAMLLRSRSAPSVRGLVMYHHHYFVNHPVTLVHRAQHSLAASYYRGGTSRAIFFQEQDLPKDRESWAQIFLNSIGSKDPNGRQLDGMGGGISSLSKVCVVGPSHQPDADVNYTFVALGIKDDSVDYSSNCGNMTSAVGPYAVDTHLIDVPPPQKGEHKATVRILNTNTNKIIHATFPVTDEGEAEVYGDFSIDGVAGTHSQIQLDFINPAGSKTGTLFPTGSKVDKFDNDTPATCIDVGNPCVFVNAHDVGIEQDCITPAEMEAHPTLLSTLNRIRRAAGVKMGLADTTESVTGSIPKIALVLPPATNVLPSGEKQSAKDIDILVRAVSVGQPHRAVPITVALSIAAAAKIPGTTVHDCCSQIAASSTGELTIGHSSGKLLVGAQFEDETGEIISATIFRTARRLFAGKVYWK